jgi:hypothetical protein
VLWKIQMRNRRNKFKTNKDKLDLCDYAAKALKNLGFVKSYTSMQSEACYYKLPNAKGLIRVASHRFGRTEQRINQEKVIAIITFGENYFYNSIDKVDSYIAASVGKYLMLQKQSISINSLEQQCKNTVIKIAKLPVETDQMLLDFRQVFDNMCVSRIVKANF